MPRLVIKQGPGVGRDFKLGPMACVVGRDASADFVLEDGLTSRRHFRVVLKSGRYAVEDLGSTNGTRVNGRRIDAADVWDGDRIEVGATTIVFVQKDLLAGPSGPLRRRRRRA